MDPEDVDFRPPGELPNDKTSQLIKKLEARIDSQEQLVANLMMAYAEVWVAVESLTATMLETKTPEEQQEYMKYFREFRANLLKSLGQVSEGGLDGVDPDVLATMESMVTGL